MVHVFDRACNGHEIIHKLTKPHHPWTNGQAETMNRTVKGATVEVFHSETLDELNAHVLAFVTAYNFAKHLERLRWRTPFQALYDAWTRKSGPFEISPHHLIPGPHTYVSAGLRIAGRSVPQGGVLGTLRSLLCYQFLGTVAALACATVAVRDCGLALPTGSPLKEDVNRAVLTVTQRPGWKGVKQRYFGAGDL